MCWVRSRSPGLISRRSCRSRRPRRRHATRLVSGVDAGGPTVGDPLVVRGVPLAAGQLAASGLERRPSCPCPLRTPGPPRDRAPPGRVTHPPHPVRPRARMRRAVAAGLTGRCRANTNATTRHSLRVLDAGPWAPGPNTSWSSWTDCWPRWCTCGTAPLTMCWPAGSASTAPPSHVRSVKFARWRSSTIRAGLRAVVADQSCAGSGLGAGWRGGNRAGGGSERWGCRVRRGR